MKVVCCDTSFLRSLYGTDVHTPVASAELLRLQAPLLLTSLNLFEFNNSLRFAECRKLLPRGKSTLLQSTMQRDLQAGKVAQAVWCGLAKAMVEAKRLSTGHTLTGGHRSFDVLHVAAAIHLQADVFLTFDANQRSLALSAGLMVCP